MSINLTKVPTLSHESREQIQLICRDQSLQAKEKVKEIIHTEIRGGRGNARLMGWTSGRIDDKEALFVTALREEPLYDYRKGSKQHKEWANIEVGKDIYRFSRDEIHDYEECRDIIAGCFSINSGCIFHIKVRFYREMRCKYESID